MALITASDYKTYRGISDTSLDAQLAVLIPIAQSRLESLCGRPSGGFESATWTHDFDGKGGPSLFVRCWPVTSITSVSWRSSDGDLTALDSTTYWISDDARSVERSGATVARGLTNPNSISDDFDMPLTGMYPAFFEGLKNYRVIYVGGYASNAIPAELKMAMYRMLDQMFADIGQAGDLKSESDGHYSYTKSDSGFGGSPDDPLSITSLVANWRPLL